MKRESAARRGRKGFTLIELLVVLGIIIILMGLLFPVISGIRKQARKTDTMALMSRLQSAINNYYGDFRAYPGPFSENQIYPVTVATPPYPQPPSCPNPTSAAPTDQLTATSGPLLTIVTSSENLFLGLEGGISYVTTASPTFAYDPTKLATGPQSLNPLSPKTHVAYYNYQDAETTITSSTDPLSGKCANQGNSFLNGIISASMTTTDSVIPEFIDKFTPAMPILYLRARSGRGIVQTPPATWGIVSETATDPPAQYNFMQLAPYSFTTVNTSDYPLPSPNPPVYGSPALTGMPLYTNVTAYFMNPALQTSARNKDGYILISAGQDGIFGTADDIFIGN